ncbi:MAG: hypothetical protein ACRDGG_00265, partial [Anaerolineae bacterium]
MSFRNPLRWLRLSALLIGINVGLLLLAVAGVAIVAVSLLQRLADDQALARVAQAGASAQNAIDRAGDELLSDAQLLAERPTLLRLLQSNDAESLNAFLRQFQQTSQLDGTVVIVNDRVFAQSGAPIAWETVWVEHQPSNSYFFHRQTGDVPLMMGAQVAVSSLPEARVLAAKLLDSSFAQEISDELGLSVTILEREAALAESPLSTLRSTATEQTMTARRDDLGVYLAVSPLRAPSGGAAGFVETALPSTSIAASLQRLNETLLILTLAVAALAALV